MNFDLIFTALEASADPAAVPTYGMGSLLFSCVLMIAVFYFIAIRPQQKQEKEKKAMQETLQIGDEIVTIGGIVGFVVSKKEDTIVIETGGDRSKLIVQMWAIRENLTQHDEQEEIAKKKK